jgi:5,10-methenyltetrahydrofolate synthetase
MLLDKQEIRQHMRSLRSQMDNEAILRDSRAIAKTVVALPEYRNAGCIMAYAPIQNEVMASLITELAERDGKKVCLPRIADKTMIEAVPRKITPCLETPLALTSLPLRLKP